MAPLGEPTSWYGLPPPPPTAAVSVTTRQVPVRCGVCRGGYVRDPADIANDDAEWVRCDACDGKGWLMVTETTTTRIG